MTPGDYGAIGAAVFTALSAGGVFWGAWIARSAARTWRGVHEHAKADECIAAAYDLVHAVDRTIDERNRLEETPRAPGAPPPFPGEVYDAAWAAWRRLQLTHVVAFRYHAPRMDRLLPSRYAKLLDDLKTWSASIPQDLTGIGTPFDHTAAAAAAAEAERIKLRMWREAEGVDTALTPPRDEPGQGPFYIGRPGRQAWWLPKL